MYRYRLYGLNVLSEFPFADGFPARFQEDSSCADVVIRRGIVNNMRGPQLAAGDYIVASSDIFLIVPGVARYRVENGARVTVEIATGASLTDVCAYLLGSVMGALLHQRRLYPLHGSAALLGSTVSVFLGPSGAGKSTTVALLAAQGCSIISDDVLVTRQEGGRFLAECSFPVVKLLPDSRAILKSRKLAEAGRIELPKRRIVDPSLFAVGLFPLTRLYFLGEPGPASSISVLTPFEILQRLRENVYRPALLEALAHEGTFFAFATELTQVVRGFAISRGQDNADFIATLMSPP